MDKVSNRIKYCCFGIVLLGLVFRLFLFDNHSPDYGGFLSHWINHIKMYGFPGFKDDFYNYTPTYIYLLAIVAKSDIYPLYGIKIISVIFDFIAAYFMAQIVFLVTKKQSFKWISFALVSILPSVILNGSFMAQCDSVYVSVILASIYFLLKRNNLVSVILLGLAFALKAQTSIVLPFFFVYMLRGGIRWYYFLMIPVIYIITIIPAWIAGRPFLDLLLIYKMQSEYYESVVAFFPNIYVWIQRLINYDKNIGMIFTVILTLTAGLLLCRKKYIFSLQSWIQLLFISAIVCPFFLPGMRERYMFLGDILAIGYMFMYPKKIYLPLGIIFISFYSYIRCFHYFTAYADYPQDTFVFFEFIPWRLMALAYFGIIVLTIINFVKTLKDNRPEDEFRIKDKA
ncbi:hypothetical protein [Prevotella sp. 10(H)]|uniref:hypothetical protein n=1 Tax=Prevotella sp. 10(H) TaxID=1158294 RepID=UPI00068D1EB0|nr:hypothetical protein [Prevotella sp. 10(H)]